MNNEVKKRILDYFNKDKRIIDNPTCYFYDLAQISRQIKQIQNYAGKNVSLYYAMKANPNKEVISHVLSHECVKGIEIASTGELDIALDSGLESTDRILFTGPGKTPVELERVVRDKIRFINVESLVEAIRINEIAQKLNVDKVDILLRVNIDYYADGVSEHMAGVSTKLGIDQKVFLDTFKEIQKLSHLNVCGLHVFAADGVLDYNVLLKYADNVFKYVKEIEPIIPNIQVIDFGGGFGIDYTKENKVFDTKKFFEGLDELVHQYNFEDKEMILELGKYIVGNGGYYVTEIIDIKDCKGQKHIVCAGGVNHMRLPIAADRRHPLYIINRNLPDVYEGQPRIQNEVVDVEGPLCMTEDKISWNELIEDARIGDLVVLTQSGAYCYSDSTLWFLSHPLPEEIILR